MKERIIAYLDSLILTPMITYRVGENKADQIFCITYYDDGPEPLTSFLISSWDKEEDWKFKLRDAYIQCIAIVTGDTSILRDRYNDID